MAPSTPFTPCRIATGSIILVVGAIFIFQGRVIDGLQKMHRESCETSVGPVSTFNSPSSPYVFPEVSRLEVLGPDGDQAWRNLNTNKGGFIWIQYNETFDIPWGVSMFHGIHCLQMLRAEFQVQLGLASAGAGHHHHHGDKGGHIATQLEQGRTDADIVHLGHCLAYIAEMLNCVGDSTIEHPWIEFDDQTGDILEHGVDGSRVQHQCRNTKHIWKAVEASEEQAIRKWDHKPGDTVEAIFGGSA